IVHRATFCDSFCSAPEGGWMIEAEIVTRRRKWTADEKAVLLAEVEAEGGKVKLVARRHGISESLVDNWSSAWRMAPMAAAGTRRRMRPTASRGEAMAQESGERAVADARCASGVELGLVSLDEIGHRRTLNRAGCAGPTPRRAGRRPCCRKEGWPRR